MTGPVSPPLLRKRLKLHFFPTSFPDETLYSRVSRYHLLTGEQKDEATFIELFEQEGPKVNFAGLVPGSVAALASLLPGDLNRLRFSRHSRAVQNIAFQNRLATVFR